MSRCTCILLLLTFLVLLSLSTNARAIVEPMSLPMKRRMVIRVPFMQNPDSEQLSRIFYTSFTEQKRKKFDGYGKKDSSDLFY
ncbi:hypothetical protein KIN20_015915 [Parelaphostrongylus tenuis]|uniref:Uncharacterized protein n=1 Tax=Parelaphostrongylus tenuis TaxID=148309 RepID=A0AAD5QMK8_PARTN|nr:hypothetical protein KIN20_015915 [Parelaphostrongylus tenuis]